MEFAAHRFQNRVQTCLLILAMAALLAAIGFVLFGKTGVIVLGLLGGALLLFSPSVSPKLVLRTYRAKPEPIAEDHQLHLLVEQLAYRAELTEVPKLYYLPSSMVNAFAIGSQHDAVIGVTDGLLRVLSGRELTAVLAHEVAHIQHNDMRAMMTADLMTRGTHMLSTAGKFLLILNLPLMCAGAAPVPWIAVILLIFAPNVMALLQLGLSRSREYDADLGAVQLTGDPRGLVAALRKLERVGAGNFERVLLPGRGIPEPSLLRTHPKTEDRINRLVAYEEILAKGDPAAGRAMPLSPKPTAPPQDWRPGARISATAPLPRWHKSGAWF